MDWVMEYLSWDLAYGSTSIWKFWFFNTNGKDNDCNWIKSSKMLIITTNNGTLLQAFK